MPAMAVFRRVQEIELIGPTSIGLRLDDGEGGPASDQIVISPVHFITDFSVFLTAVRAAGETSAVDKDPLNRSWEEARETLRKQLIEEDPWGAQAVPLPGEEAIVALGAERLKALRTVREEREHPSRNEPPSDAK
jgi:hypothetical protein